MLNELTVARDSVLSTLYSSQPSIVLKPLSLAYAGAMQRLASYPEVAQSCLLPTPYPLGESVRWLKAHMLARKQGRAFGFAIVAPKEGFIGLSNLPAIDRQTKTCQLAFWIGRPYWNRGYATAAVRQTMRFAFVELGIERVYTCALHDNHASIRILENMGFDRVRIEPNTNPKFSPSARIIHYCFSFYQR